MPNPLTPEEYCLEMITIPTLTDALLLKHSFASAYPTASYSNIHVLDIAVDQGIFSSATRDLDFPPVSVRQSDQSLWISCPCLSPKNRLCEHQALVLSAIMRRKEFRIFFDPKLRQEAIKSVARDYGLENEPCLDDYFRVDYEPRSFTIRPRQPGLLRLTSGDKEALTTQLIAKPRSLVPVSDGQPSPQKRIVVFTKHRYNDNFSLELFEAPTARDGKIKSPLTPLQPLELLTQLDQVSELKFYSALAKFQNPHRTKKEETDLKDLQLVVENPAKLAFYYHDTRVSENITSHSLVPVSVKTLSTDLHLLVRPVHHFYELEGHLTIEKPQSIHNLVLKYDYFIFLNDELHLINKPDSLRVIDYFSRKNDKIVIHESKFEDFRQAVLAPLEDTIRIDYAHLQPATPAQLEEGGFHQQYERLLYLSASEDYVILTPVMKYGKVEVPVMSKKPIYSTDSRGKPFSVARDDAAEIQFTMAVAAQHPDFQNQLGQTYFYLHRKHVLDEDWFLNAFEAWHNQDIRILGFNSLQNNRLNPYKAKVSVVVNSGLNWFETELGLSFGKQKVTLKHLHKAVKNKSRFVPLDDGTLGVLPVEWLERFSGYFLAGEVVEERIRTPRIGFSQMQELYDEGQLSSDAKNQLQTLTTQFADFQSIRPVEIPAELRATLRDYQKEGLNWLNFLDEIGFGGCLADDMGLGKTLQIIAFLLIQKAKNRSGANLIIVPTSLLFNWQAEVAKFAPTLRLYTFHGANRILKETDLDSFDIILTSYGTLVSSVRFLKECTFNYIILDESQAIKNPESQRYHAARLLQSRNKLVLTGTPIENNTFDLFGQLSFACPGLLGNFHHFRAHYSTPIDKFDDRKRARELQQKIRPFLLRRTKAQVATELPDKTEMIIHCEMGPEQRKVYDAYEQEFRNFLLSTKEGDIPRSRLHVLQGLTKLRQICNSPVLLNDDEFYGNASAKIEMLVEQIESKSPQHKILVFSQFVSMLDLIRKELEFRNIRFEYLTGQTTHRATSVNRFQEDSSVRVFLISLKAGGTGLNLTQADYVYLVDPWWNPAVENQAIDRSYRIGQKKNVVAVRLICPDTIEEKILALQDSKKELADHLVKTDTALLKSLTKNDLLRLLQ
ncbi:DEAD/DEAH box helicase [Larkinella rosea]|uniref:DEAD/DEAH box helicase n=1 Tax=Larkinella rosea TaxID=2025312 RepID=A0A3P1C0E2_9BACT|nr:DEAD/DEAH box helicase [Larkinella rosea]RRB06718.1 DEAD/DEAH box helicase [Larkinella rosea]